MIQIPPFLCYVPKRKFIIIDTKFSPFMFSCIIFREGPSCSTSNLESKSKKIIKQNRVFDGDFLTLAPPTTTSMCSSSKFKHPPSNLIYCKLPDLESLAYQVSLNNKLQHLSFSLISCSIIQGEILRYTKLKGKLNSWYILNKKKKNLAPLRYKRNGHKRFDMISS